jgi:hypothetical protein
MLASRHVPCLLFGVALCGAALGAEEETPELAFLEYLGMWEESDEEWLLLEDEALARNDKQGDPVPEGDASTENQDES